VPGVSASPTPGPVGTELPYAGISDTPDPSVFVALGAIFVLGFALLMLATWYSARRARR
jgi:ABC-type lipoprotein release transport system permease subunit